MKKFVILFSIVKLFCLNASDPTYDGLIDTKHIEAKGVGYEDGYSTIKGMYFQKLTHENIYPFLDVAMHVFDNTDLAANLGIGSRFYVPSRDTYFGMNLYYDYRSENERKYNFSALGFGFEALHRYFDFRLNAVFPLNPYKTTYRCLFDDYVGGYWMEKKNQLVSLYGGNFEFGAFLHKSDPISIYLASGPYYYNRDCITSFGGSVRLLTTLNNFLYFEGIYQHDNLFNTRMQGVIGIQLTFGDNRKTFSRKHQKVVRPEIIVLNQRCYWDWNF